MSRHQYKTTRIMIKQGNIIPKKEINKVPVIDCKLMEIYELSDKEFRIILKEFQGSTRKHR